MLWKITLSILVCIAPVMARGGCQITTNTSRIDARLETRLGSILSELLGTERQATAARGGSSA